MNRKALTPHNARRRWLGTLEERVRSGQTGAQWTLGSLCALGTQGTRDMRLRNLAAAIKTRQQTNEPVHRWPLIEANEREDWRESYQTIGQFMSTDLFTVRPDDLVDLAASVMHWKHVRHVPVEDDEGRLVGLVSHRDLLRLMSLGLRDDKSVPVAVRSVMKPNPVTASPDTPTLDAIELMRRHKCGCLPVVDKGHLVGMVTAHDFLAVSATLFEAHLKS